jgi:pyruvate dehydrogenase phosphatase
LQYPANEPCEDRFNCYQLKNSNAYYAAVFDGHGGWQVAENAKTEEDIKKAIKIAYDRVEKDWVTLAQQAFTMGYPKIAYVGSCALVTVVKDNKLYVANAGDSKAVLLRKKDDGSYEHIKVSKTFNANKKYE